MYMPAALTAKAAARCRGPNYSSTETASERSLSSLSVGGLQNVLAFQVPGYGRSTSLLAHLAARAFWSVADWEQCSRSAPNTTNAIMSAATHEPLSNTAGAGTAQSPKPGALVSIFSADHKDMMLLGYYTALLKLFDGASNQNDPTVCTKAEEIVDWLGYVVIIVIYILRHFWLEVTNLRHMLAARIVRALLFAAFTLCIHSQPLSCSLPRHTVGNSTVDVDRSEHLHTLSFVQGAIMLTLALIASETCRRQLMASDEEAVAEAEHPMTTVATASPTTAAAPSDTATTSA